MHREMLSHAKRDKRLPKGATIVHSPSFIIIIISKGHFKAVSGFSWAQLRAGQKPPFKGTKDLKKLLIGGVSRESGPYFWRGGRGDGYGIFLEWNTSEQVAHCWSIPLQKGISSHLRAFLKAQFELSLNSI